MRLILVLLAFSFLSCSEKKKPAAIVEKADSLVVHTDSIKMLEDDSMVTMFINYNRYSSSHKEQKEAFNYWYYDTPYYQQRIAAQSREHKKRNLVVPPALKRVWIPVYAIDSVFYIQRDNDAQLRFDINDSTFNFFNGMMPVEPFIMDEIKMKPNGFEITHRRRSEKIEMTKVEDARTIYKVSVWRECFYVTPLSNINKFPIIVIKGKKGATTIEGWIELDEVKCN